MDYPVVTCLDLLLDSVLLLTRFTFLALQNTDISYVCMQDNPNVLRNATQSPLVV